MEGVTWGRGFGRTFLSYRTAAVAADSRMSRLRLCSNLSRGLIYSRPINRVIVEQIAPLFSSAHLRNSLTSWDAFCQQPEESQFGDWSNNSKTGGNQRVATKREKQNFRVQSPLFPLHRLIVPAGLNCVLSPQSRAVITFRLSGGCQSEIGVPPPIYVHLIARHNTLRGQKTTAERDESNSVNKKNATAHNYKLVERTLDASQRTMTGRSRSPIPGTRFPFPIGGILLGGWGYALSPTVVVSWVAVYHKWQTGGRSSHASNPFEFHNAKHLPPQPVNLLALLTRIFPIYSIRIVI